MLKSRKSDLEVVSFPLCLQPFRLEGLESKRSFMILSQILLPFGHILVNWKHIGMRSAGAAFKRSKLGEPGGQVTFLFIAFYRSSYIAELTLRPKLGSFL